MRIFLNTVCRAAGAALWGRQFNNLHFPRRSARLMRISVAASRRESPVVSCFPETELEFCFVTNGVHRPRSTCRPPAADEPASFGRSPAGIALCTLRLSNPLTWNRRKR
jgi:hypothetical protein